jgi:rare lipoprotein A
MKKFMMICMLLVCTLMSGMAETTPTQVEHGKATYYSQTCRNITSSGERLHPEKLTCAHKVFPFGTLLKVTNKKNGKSVVVKVNDRGPFVKGRIVDLSWSAARELDMLKAGVVDVVIEVISLGDKKR